MISLGDTFLPLQDVAPSVGWGKEQREKGDHCLCTQWLMVQLSVCCVCSLHVRLPSAGSLMGRMCELHGAPCSASPLPCSLTLEIQLQATSSFASQLHPVDYCWCGALLSGHILYGILAGRQNVSPLRQSLVHLQKTHEFLPF